jgi:hypothetical protein
MSTMHGHMNIKYTRVLLKLGQDKYSCLIALCVAYTYCLSKFESVRLSARVLNLEFYKAISINSILIESTKITMQA